MKITITVEDESTGEEIVHGEYLLWESMEMDLGKLERITKKYYDDKQNKQDADE